MTDETLALLGEVRMRRVVVVATLLVALAMAAGVAAYLVKSKTVLLNPVFVSVDGVTGVDVSAYQGDVDMEALAAQGVRFVYVKATEGSSYVDPAFSTNWERARACGLPAGAYHFFSYDSPGDTQARNYISAVGDLQGSLIPVVDVEFYGDKQANPPRREDVWRELGTLLGALEERYHARPMVYTSRDCYDALLRGFLDGYPLWVRSVYYPVWFDGWGDDWTMWQYCDTAVLDGYVGEERCIDLDVLARGVTLDDLTVPAEAH